MVDINLYDYTEVITDPYWGYSYEIFHCIGSGNLAAAAIKAQIQAAGTDDITVHINSVGGSVFDGFAIYNDLKSHPGKVIVRIEGLAASIASIIAMAGEEIIICQAAMLMVHKPTIDPFWCGAMNADDLQREANALTQIEAVLNDIYATRTGLGSTKIQNLIDAETWLTPDTAMTLGFADSIEKTITEKPVIVQPAYNYLFQNANNNIKAYANSAFKIKNMSTPNDAALKAANETIQKTNKLLDFFKNKFPSIFGGPDGGAKNASATLANGNAIYYPDGEEFAEGTKVYEDADQTKALADGDYVLSDNTKISVADGSLTSVTEVTVEPTDSVALEELKAQLLQRDATIANQATALNAANETLEKLQKIKSSYVPPKAKTEFQNSENKDQKNDTQSAIEAAAEKRKEKLNKK